MCVVFMDQRGEFVGWIMNQWRARISEHPASALRAHQTHSRADDSITHTHTQSVTGDHVISSPAGSHGFAPGQTPQMSNALHAHWMLILASTIFFFTQNANITLQQITLLFFGSRLNFFTVRKRITITMTERNTRQWPDPKPDPNRGRLKARWAESE